ncbi:MAG: adenylate kinase [Gemmatimonadetes bacterium]|nr:adenylate kinase [Gemmatimonadota bacterium]MYG86373.1 adenylate kinase [Gemmatimonadota bacterium]MYJ91217.1 adenylate kinase [Gemmatimonadota bacterium]
MTKGSRATFRGVPLGSRVHVTGNSCSGKSTLGRRIASALDVPHVELDALNWEPGWVSLAEKDPEELERQISDATSGDGWVVSGSYMGFSMRTFWSRVETVVWLDLPVHRLLWRVLVRSWKRSRSKELLWGTNYERFWPQLKVWNREDSLVWWIVTQQGRKRRRMRACMEDLEWRHIAFVRLGSNAEIEAFLRTVKGIRP